MLCGAIKQHSLEGCLPGMDRQNDPFRASFGVRVAYGKSVAPSRGEVNPIPAFRLQAALLDLWQQSGSRGVKKQRRRGLDLADCYMRKGMSVQGPYAFAVDLETFHGLSGNIVFNSGRRNRQGGEVAGYPGRQRCDCRPSLSVDCDTKKFRLMAQSKCEDARKSQD